jgi:hypothetical protein
MPGTGLNLRPFFREFGSSSSSKNIPPNLFKGGIKDLQKQDLLSRWIQFGREIDSSEYFLKAISFDCLSARAELALLCFIMNLPKDECQKAFVLVQEGSRLGCADCRGMVAHFFATGHKGIVTPCNETAYELACQSASSGSWFGKMALAHFLAFYPGYHDEYDDKFDIYWDDPFICNFASPMQQLPNHDGNIVFSHDQLFISKQLIAEIQKEHARNLDMPKVWVNLPKFQPAIVLDE